MFREKLAEFEGARVLVSAIMSRRSYAIELSSKPKTLLVKVMVDGIDSEIGHVWVTIPKSIKIYKNENIAFTAKVSSYLSLDDNARHVTKMGLISLKNIKVGKSRKHAVAMTKQSIASGKEKMLERQNKKKEKDEAIVK